MGFHKCKLLSVLRFLIFALIYTNFALVTDIAIMKILEFFIYNSNLHYNSEI